MESYELPHSENLRVVASCPWVEPLDDRRHVTEYTGIHQSYKITINIIAICVVWISVILYFILLIEWSKKRSNNVTIVLKTKVKSYFEK